MAGLLARKGVRSIASQTLYPKSEGERVWSNSEGSFVHIDSMKIVAGMRSNYVITGFCQCAKKNCHRHELTLIKIACAEQLGLTNLLGKFANTQEQVMSIIII